MRENCFIPRLKLDIQYLRNEKYSYSRDQQHLKHLGFLLEQDANPEAPN